MVKWHNLVAILFLAFKNRTYLSGFKMVKNSLDCYINKSHNKYFIHAKTV
jgi:hypothetical protein